MKKNLLKNQDLNSNIFIGFLRGVQLGITNFWRNKILSFATIIVIGVILFIFNIILAVQFIAEQAIQSVSERLDLVIELQDDVDFYKAQNFLQKLEKMEEIKTVHYTSKEEALEIVAKTHPETVELYKRFNLKNPLPPSISIILKKPEDYKKIQKFLEESEFKNLFKETSVNQNQENEVLSSVGKNLNNINSFVRQIIFWVILAFLIGGTLIIINAIQLTIYTRRNEIYIMRLVGATPGFIRLPFIFEGIMYSVLAVLLSFFFLFILSKTIQMDEVNLWYYYNNFQRGNIFIVELAATICIGIMSSFSAVEQYMKSKLST